MATTPTGTLFAVASAFGAAKNTTVVTNAAEAVVTSAAHGYSNGDIVEITSGWGRLNKRAFKLKSVATDTFVLEGADTSNTEYFPAGSGIGSVRKVSTWQQISKVMNPTSSGGQPKTVNYKYTESDVEYSLNDGFSAMNEEFDIDADEFGNAGYTALKTLTDVQSDTIMRKTLKSGSVIYTPCRIALNENPTMTDGQIMTCKVSVSGNNRITRY